ncbi:twin-arginine translocation signal domain-containing protein [Streptomyces sp. NPDC001595]
MSAHQWTRRQILGTAAGTGAALGASALMTPGVAQAHDGRPGSRPP